MLDTVLALHMHHFLSYDSSEVGTINFYRERTRHREVKLLVQSHTPGKGWSQDLIHAARFLSF